MEKRLSVIIPCYNESDTLLRVIEKVAAEKPWVGQIIVVNDGSTDGTRHLLDELKTSWADPTVDLQIIHFERNTGKGAAVRAAIRRSSQDYILIQDADLELDPADYAALMKPVAEQKAVAVVGNRFPDGFPKDLHYASRAANWVVTKLSNALFGLHLKDQACGYKLMPVPLANELGLQCDGFEICSEIIAQLGRRRVPIENVAVHYRPRDAAQGKKIRWIDGFVAVYTLLRLRLKS